MLGSFVHCADSVHRFAEVQPGQVGALGPVVTDRRHVLRNIVLGEGMIVVDVGKQLVEPLAAVAVGRLVGDTTQRADRAEVIMLDTLQQGRVGRVPVGILHAGHVESLAGRIEGQAVVDDVLVRQPCEWHVFVARADEIGMDLVGEDNHIVLEAHLAKLEQLFLSPDIARRVLRIADDHRLRLWIGEPCSQVVPVDLVAAIPALHLALVGDRVSVTRHEVESGIIGGQQNDFAAWPRESPQRRDQSWIDAGRKLDGRGIEFELVALGIELGDGFLERVRAAHVAPGVVFATLGERLCNARRAFEVHGCDAHAVLEFSARILTRRRVPARTVPSAPFVDLVEIVAAVPEQPLAIIVVGNGNCRRRARQRRHAGALEEAAAVQLCVLRHRCLP